ncbi:YhcN/YlaJ family sporulation lipoprotein [Paenibacillus sp. PR3]|uniref:YhcN/YlaJ family sporulation lipoprotein n=1 Tax=Paenibacillus terricola TaxID=2763503 RepID=A0ABR8MV47_9BACL|nr:YhcN/YlaJ family sporulation lipoprotein [Paenibacillus terricola]MBD3919827.1 YhcN/YlaJ family sporulation lipoprotein [Paenibacillus terricola]
MQQKFKMIAASVALGTMLAGCAANQGDLGNRHPVEQQSVRYDMMGNQIVSKRFANDQMNEMNRIHGLRQNSNNIVGIHDNYRLEMSQNIADSLASKNLVKSAKVMLTNHNAYVAVTLHDGVSPGGSNTMQRSSLGMTSNGYGSKPLPSTPSPGASFNGTMMNNTDVDRTGQLGYRVMGLSNKKHAYKGASGMNSVPNATGIGVTGAPRYGTYSTNNNNGSLYHVRSGGEAANADMQLTEQVKSSIAAEVKRMAPGIDHVYISANPDFVDRMNGYWDDVKAGHPIQGFIAEFNAMVDRIFPVKVDTRR